MNRANAFSKPARRPFATADDFSSRPAGFVSTAPDSWRRSRKRGSRSAFTLIELLVVMAIIGMLLALTLPAIGMVRERSRMVQCQNNLKQVGLAFHNHEEQWSKLPQDGVKGWGHCVFILPALDQRPLFDLLAPQLNSLPDPTKARVGAEDQSLPVFLCPSHFSDKVLAGSGFGRGDYLGTTNIFAKQMSLTDVRDGESQTLLAGESTKDHGWALPGTGTTGNGPNSGTYGSEHSGGAYFVLCDGSVKFIQNTISPATFSALATPRGKDVVGEY